MYQARTVHRTSLRACAGRLSQNYDAGSSEGIGSRLTARPWAGNRPSVSSGERTVHHRLDSGRGLISGLDSARRVIETLDFEIELFTTLAGGRLRGTRATRAADRHHPLPVWLASQHVGANAVHLRQLAVLACVLQLELDDDQRGVIRDRFSRSICAVMTKLPHFLGCKIGSVHRNGVAGSSPRRTRPCTSRLVLRFMKPCSESPWMSRWNRWNGTLRWITDAPLAV